MMCLLTLVVASATMGQLGPQADAAGHATIRGRFLRPDGQPAEGVRLSLTAWLHDRARLVRHGRVVEWEDIETRTDAHGTFLIEFEPPPPYDLKLYASASGLVEQSWRWTTIEPGAVEDLGLVKMEEGATVLARVLHPSGDPITEGFYARVEKEDGRSNRYVYPNAQTGELRFEGVPEGKLTLHAYFELYDWIEGPEVNVRAGETKRVDFEYSGPDLSTRIKVLLQDRVFGESPAGEYVRLVGPSGSYAPTKSDYLGHVFEGLSPDQAYTIEVVDPRFEPWKREEVRPGTAVRGGLTGSCGARITVLDGVTGQRSPPTP